MFTHAQVRYGYGVRPPKTALAVKHFWLSFACPKVTPQVAQKSCPTQAEPPSHAIRPKDATAALPRWTPSPIRLVGLVLRCHRLLMRGERQGASDNGFVFAKSRSAVRHGGTNMLQRVGTARCIASVSMTSGSKSNAQTDAIHTNILWLHFSRRRERLVEQNAKHVTRKHDSTIHHHKCANFSKSTQNG